MQDNILFCTSHISCITCDKKPHVAKWCQNYGFSVRSPVLNAVWRGLLKNKWLENFSKPETWFTLVNAFVIYNLKKRSVAQCHEYCILVYLRHGEVPPLPGPRLNTVQILFLELDDFGCVHNVAQSCIDPHLDEVTIRPDTERRVLLIFIWNCLDVEFAISYCQIYEQYTYLEPISKCWPWSWRMSVSVLYVSLF